MTVDPTSTPLPSDPERLARRQILTIVLLFVGYSGYYLCRSNLAVAMPLIQKELVGRGMSLGAAKEQLGWVVSLGILAYLLGKFLGGGLTDFLGGRRPYLAGMAGSVAFTLLFVASGVMPWFAIAWFGNRAVQSIGWPGIIKLVSRWFSFRRYGGMMALVSLSFLFGDAVARAFMGRLLAAGLGWRSMFVVAAACLAAIFAGNWLLLRESPRELGLPEPDASPSNVFGVEGADARPEGIRALLLPLLRDVGFWLVCGLSAGLTLLRETFNTWTNTYFSEGVGLTAADAADASSLFPLFGGISVILCGFASDRLGRGGRAAIMVVGLSAAAALLGTLGLADLGVSRAWPIAMVAATGFLLIGPYSFLAGAIALDFGGKRGGATASGLVDGFGYLGGLVAGLGVAMLANRFGWEGVFLCLAGIAAASALLAIGFLGHQIRVASSSESKP